MSYITATDLQLRFGRQVILDGASFAVGEQDRIGLVGPNGSGKSTLLKILHREMTPDEGQISYARRLRVGYLPQDITELAGDTLLNSVLAAVPGRAALEERLAAVEVDLEHAEDSETQMTLAQTLADVHEELAHFEDQFSPHMAMRILQGLGFAEAEYARDLRELSGGWKMRAALAGLLFQQPDVLLLDEPTNHLDIPSVRWLQSFLRQFHHALVLISHDRTFLNAEVNRIISFEIEGLRTYPGDYEHYVTLRDEEVRVLQSQAKNQDQKRKQMEAYIARFRVSARRSSQAQSRLKELEKMDAIKVPRRRRTLSFRFPPVERCGEVPLKTEDMRKAFGDNVIYEGLTVNVMRGDRIGIIGVNGAGKTTLLRILAGELAADSGTVETGYHVSLGYYAQHHAEILSPSNSVLREVMYAATEVTEQRARNMLGLFMFSGDNADKPVSVLSGGEKARVALARIMVQSHNVLLMDEPTNHLDLDSSEALAQALHTFDGTLVFVSHNQSFVNALATKIWDVSDGRLVEFPGNLKEYFAHCERRDAKAAAPEATAGRTAPVAPAVSEPKQVDEDRGTSGRPKKKQRRKPGRASLGGQDRRTVSKKARTLEKEVNDLERRIGDLERKQVEQEAKLGQRDVYENHVLFQSILTEFEADRETLQRLMTRWESKQAELAPLQEALREADAK